MKNKPITSVNRALLVFVVAVLAGCASKDRLPSPPPVAMPAPPAPVMPTSSPPPRPQPPPVTASAPQPELDVQGNIWIGPDIFFDAKSATLKPAEKSKLKELATQFNNKGILHIKTYKDSSKNTAFNNLSIKRADAVTAYLKSLGVDPRRIGTYDQNTKSPVADNKTADRHDRVGIEIYSQGEILDWKPENQIPVLFATNRRRTGEDKPINFYGNELADEAKADFQRGRAVIKVPPKHVRGKVERPDLLRVTWERITNTGFAKFLRISEFTAEDNNVHFSYVDKIQELKKSEFGIELAKAIEKSKSKTAVVYVHGYANDFSDAAFRTAQIAHDLATPEYDVVPLMFSWPSDPGIIKMDYREARNLNRLKNSGEALATFLQEIKDNTEIGTVHIIAHSMGAEVLGRAMKLLDTKMGSMDPNNPTFIKPVFRQIIFAAPDVSVKTFNDVIVPAIDSHHAITTYGTGGDIALWFSSLVNGEKRQGQLPRRGAKDCVDMVDVTAAAKDGDFLKHSTWSESKRVLDDLRLMLRDGLKPSPRGLTPKAKEEGDWVLPEIDSWKNRKLDPKSTPKTSAAWGCTR